jgi:hypothetical protein
MISMHGLENRRKDRVADAHAEHLALLQQGTRNLE